MRRVKYSSYIIAGSGIGLRVVLVVAAVLALLSGLFLYVRFSMAVSDIPPKLKDLPAITVVDGRIVAPIEVNKTVKLADGGKIIYDTMRTDIAGTEIPEGLDGYITATQIFIPIKSRCPYQTKKLGNYTPISVEKLPNGTIKFEKQFNRFKSIVGLFCVGIGLLMFIAILLTFGFLYVLILGINMLFRHNLTAGQVGRLLVAPYCMLLSAISVFGFLISSAYIPWFMLLPVVYFSIDIIISIYFPMLNGFSDLILNEIPFLFKLPWIVGIPMVLIWYFIWSGSISIYRDRQKALLDLMKPKNSTEKSDKE
ncbi:MAG: hypothetical protein E7014_04805 [Alphaproteobacteria bacterium]|nr:hypothetical protein [Alphaproteobacteria bacterium]